MEDDLSRGGLAMRVHYRGHSLSDGPTELAVQGKQVYHHDGSKRLGQSMSITDTNAEAEKQTFKAKQQAGQETGPC